MLRRPDKARNAARLIRMAGERGEVVSAWSAPANQFFTVRSPREYLAVHAPELVP